MKSKAVQKEVELDDLILDVNNPRFAELYSGSEEEDDLIEYLLYTEAAIDVAKAIDKVGEFYPDRPLWVIEKDGKYIVKDGNRRCSAVKALQVPGKFKLGINRTVINKLPVLVYANKVDLDTRIAEEHAGSLFRRWERIAKSLEILKLHQAGKNDEMNELDSNPKDLINLASFYGEAVKVGKDDLKSLLRRGRGNTGGRTIIFERMFKHAKRCGYFFKNKPSYLAEISNRKKFDSYILALIEFLKKNPEFTTQKLDNHPDFFAELKKYGFDVDDDYFEKEKNQDLSKSLDENLKEDKDKNLEGFKGNVNGENNSIEKENHNSDGTPNNEAGNSPNVGMSISSTASGNNTQSISPASTSPKNRGTVKKRPTHKRKKLPPGLSARITEYFDNIDSTSMPNAKIAMARVTYECVLKYVIENTKSGKILFKNSGHFGTAYSKKPYTNFEELNKKFIELIKDRGVNQAFSNFGFEKMHTIIHNYHTTGRSIDAEQIKDNLIVLIEFLLQEEADLLNSLELTKIK